MNFSYPKELVKHKKVKKISETLFKVNEHSVKIQKKKGRTIIICDCDNASYFGHNNFCVHKASVFGFLWDNNFNERIEKLIKEYEHLKDIKLPISVDYMLNDLINIKRLK